MDKCLYHCTFAALELKKLSSCLLGIFIPIIEIEIREIVALLLLCMATPFNIAQGHKDYKRK